MATPAAVSEPLDLRARKRISQDPLNRWSGFDSPSYVQWPAWWRTFVHHVLSPRDLSVYLFVTSHIKTDGAVTFVYVRAIQAGLGLKSETMVRKSLATLCELGFLLRFDMQRKALRRANMKVAFQRPRVHHTLVELLARGLIDERLRAIGADDYDRDSSRRDPTTDAVLPRLVKNLYFSGLYRNYTYLQHHLTESNQDERYGHVVLRVFLETVLRTCAETPPPEMSYPRRAKLVRDAIILGLEKHNVPVPGDLWNNAATSRREISAERRRDSALQRVKATILAM